VDSGCLRWIGFGVFAVALVGLLLLASSLVVGNLVVASCGC
jgi:hypothetical protein